MMDDIFNPKTRNPAPPAVPYPEEKKGQLKAEPVA
jgi:hypothetical protein